MANELTISFNPDGQRVVISIPVSFQVLKAKENEVEFICVLDFEQQPDWVKNRSFVVHKTLYSPSSTAISIFPNPFTNQDTALFVGRLNTAVEIQMRLKQQSK